MYTQQHLLEKRWSTAHRFAFDIGLPNWGNVSVFSYPSRFWFKTSRLHTPNKHISQRSLVISWIYVESNYRNNHLRWSHHSFKLLLWDIPEAFPPRLASNPLTRKIPLRLYWDFRSLLLDLVRNIVISRTIKLQKLCYFLPKKLY